MATALPAVTGAAVDPRPGPPRRRDINSSPIFKKWVKLHLIDIHTHLCSFPEYIPDSIYFYDSRHPIRWVHIHGLVITFEEQEKRVVYTIDDGSGQVINAIIDRSYSAVLDAKLPKLRDEAKVWGTLEIVFGTFQLKISKIEKSEGFEEQVEFWKEANRIRNEILTRKTTTTASKPSKSSKAAVADGKSKQKDGTEGSTKRAKAP